MITRRAAMCRAGRRAAVADRGTTSAAAVPDGRLHPLAPRGRWIAGRPPRGSAEGKTAAGWQTQPRAGAGRTILRTIWPREGSCSRLHVRHGFRWGAWSGAKGAAVRDRGAILDLRFRANALAGMGSQPRTLARRARRSQRRAARRRSAAAALLRQGTGQPAQRLRR